MAGESFISRGRGSVLFSSCMMSEERIVLRSSLSSTLWQPHGGCEGAEEGFLRTGTECSLKVNVLQLHVVDVFCQFAANARSGNTQTQVLPISSLNSTMNCRPQLHFKGERKWLLPPCSVLVCLVKHALTGFIPHSPTHLSHGGLLSHPFPARQSRLEPPLLVSGQARLLSGPLWPVCCGTWNHALAV